MSMFRSYRTTQGATFQLSIRLYVVISYSSIAPHHIENVSEAGIINCLIGLQTATTYLIGMFYLKAVELVLQRSCCRELTDPKIKNH